LAAEGAETGRWTASRRAALVLEILRGETSVAEAAGAHGLAPAEITEWQRRFVRGGEEALRGEPAPASRLWARPGLWFAVALAALGLVWLALRAVYFNGYYTEDAPGYVTDAIYAALGTYHARDHVTGLNVGTYLPVALPLALLGKTEIALSLWPLFCSLLGLASLIGAATILFGRRAGLLAGLLYATFPGDVFFSTVVMPDAIQAGWLACSMFFVVWAFAGPGNRERWKLAAAGVAMGVCYLVRANGPILVPIGVVAVFVLARQWKGQSRGAAARGVLAYLAGWLAVQTLEGLTYLWATGDILHRVHVVNRHYGTLQSIAQWGLNTRPETIPYSIFPPLLWWRVGGWGALNQDQAYHGFLFCLAFGGLVLGALAAGFARAAVRGRALAGFVAAAFWFGWPLLYHQYGSQSLTHFVPMHRLSRHLVVYAPGAVFAAVAGGVLLWRAVPGSRIARRALVAAGLVVLALHLAFNWQAERIAYDAFHRIKATYARIRDRLPAGVGTIVGDPGDLCFFDFWLNPMGEALVRVMPFANYARCDDLPESVVLTWCNPGWEGLAAPVIRETVNRLPCLTDPPARWRLLYGGFREKIYLVHPPAARAAGSERRP
jgi:hypothetical protein